MAVITRGKTDAIIRTIKAALDEYEAQHRGAQASLYRQNPASIRVRVIDQCFAGVSKSRRHADLWNFLASRVDEDSMSEVSVLLAVTPKELNTSLMNLEFDDPVPSGL